MKTNPLLVAILALGVSACGGLSKEEISAYKSEIQYAQEMFKINSESVEKFQDIDRKILDLGIPLDKNRPSTEALANAQKWFAYQGCLEEYLEIKEPLPKAKTACAERSNIPKVL